ncbi:hypothetical protein H9L12_11280 [Sphingomonas rhizophila]|uniref:Uncharacterized protein n=1 Tax=Sphingomonas rhizophila TaxID=2071607 RepID=A0A7G9SAD6_9SPHN|nr:hypothetical protein [Sphingomonas rhizophila]QNN64811.1 hypothetical protein H9L12_11280 [Sphingomonas rhizophila]
MTTERDGRVYVFADRIAEGWAKFLGYAIPHVASGGGGFPFLVRLGVVGLEQTHWPGETGFAAQPRIALESKLEMDFRLEKLSADDIWAIVESAWIRYRRVFSIPEPTLQSKQQMRFFINSCMPSDVIPH